MSPAEHPAQSELIERIRAAAAAGTPLRIRGGGSKDFYGESLRGDLLDTRALTGITAYEPSELVVTVRAGTRLAELEAELATRGQSLPFEPPHFDGEPTVGGMVAAGLSGPARAGAGSVRDYVLGISMVNGRAEHLVFGGQVMKNVAGYDVSRLMAGSLGVLGLLTEVSLKVLPVAPGEATLRFSMRQSEALRQLNAWAGRPLPLNASCWLEGPDGPALYVRLRGAKAAVESACNHLGGDTVAPSVAQDFWAALRDQRHAWFQAPGPADLWRIAAAQTAPALDLPGATLVEWHGAQRWIRAVPEQAAAVRAAAVAAGGHATLFRLAGTAPRPGGAVARMHPLPAALARIHRELKREFDPAGIFNPGRLAADL